MTNERIMTILQNLISIEDGNNDSEYALTRLRECGCSNDEIIEMGFIDLLDGEKPNIVQYSIDVVDSDDDMQTRIENALEAAGIVVAGIAWTATWTGKGYENGDRPIYSD